MLKNILSVSGKPGLYKLLSQGKNMLLVESLADKRRFPVYPTQKVVSLGDIAIYMTDKEMPLSEALEKIHGKYGAALELDTKSMTHDELRAFMSDLFPNYDKDRVYPTDIKKLIIWYNILITSGKTEFKEQEPSKE